MDGQDAVMNMRIIREVATLFRKPMDYAILARTIRHMDGLRVLTNLGNNVDHNAVEGVRE